MAAAQLLQGLAELPFVPEDVTQVAVGLGVILLEPDGLPVLGDGLVHLALACRGDAEVRSGPR